MNAYSLQELKSASYSARIRAFSATESIGNARSAKWRGLKTVFLSHSHKDRDYALGLKGLIEGQGGQLYIDWLDEEMPPITNKETADRIRGKIGECDIFMFLATPNSMTSRWCPWEIGYADGKKPIDSIVIVPTKDDSGNFYGNEYLQLYRRLEPSQLRSFSAQPGGSPVVVRPGQETGVPVGSL